MQHCLSTSLQLRFLIIVLVLFCVGALKVHPQDGDIQEVDTLIGIPEYTSSLESLYLSKPRDIVILPDQRLLISDTENHRIVILSRDGKLIKEVGSEGTGELEFVLPQDVAVGKDKIYVADGKNNRVCVLDYDFNWIGSFDVISLPGLLLLDERENILVGSRYTSPGPFLLARYEKDDWSEDGSLGTLIGPKDIDSIASYAMNRVYALSINNGTILYCHMGVPYCRLCDYQDQEKGSFMVRKDLKGVREFFYANYFDEGKQFVPINQCDVNDFINDVIEKVEYTGTMTVAQYISDMIVYKDHILLAVSSRIHEYTMEGELVRRSMVVDEYDELAQFDSFAIDSDGYLYLLSFYGNPNYKVRYSSVD